MTQTATSGRARVLKNCWTINFSIIQNRNRRQKLVNGNRLPVILESCRLVLPHINQFEMVAAEQAYAIKIMTEHLRRADENQLCGALAELSEDVDGDGEGRAIVYVEGAQIEPDFASRIRVERQQATGKRFGVARRQIAFDVGLIGAPDNHRQLAVLLIAHGIVRLPAPGSRTAFERADNVTGDP